MICSRCHNEIKTIKDYSGNGLECRECFNRRMIQVNRDARKRRRREMADIPRLISRNGVLRVYLNGERIA